MGLLGDMGIGIAQALLAFALLGASIWLGVKVAERRGSTRWGWVAGLTTAIALGAALYPAMQALSREECRRAGVYDADECADQQSAPVDYI